MRVIKNLTVTNLHNLKNSMNPKENKLKDIPNRNSPKESYNQEKRSNPSSEIMEARRPCNDIFKVPKEKSYQPTILYLIKNVFQK